MATTIGKFELGEEIGRGPLGKVYEATNTETGEKVVFRGFARPADAAEEHWAASIKRFTEELTVAQTLDHPNIAKVIEFGEMNGMYYLATEYFRGRNLRQLLDEKGTLDENEAKPIVVQILQAVDYATTKRTMHGDLTPYNVMVMDDGTVKVINYGLGHIRSKIGSPYVAPEVLQGAEGDALSDLHAVGVLWYGMLMGRVPFEGENHQELGESILNHRPPPATMAAPHVQGIIEKLLEKDPRKRYDVGVAVINDLESGMIPAGYEHSVVRPQPMAVSWNAQEFEEDLSLGHYKLEEHDVREIHQRLVLQREVAQHERMGVGKRVALAMAALLALAFLCDGIRQVRRRARLQVVAATGQVELLSPAREGWSPLGKGHLVSSADAVRTGDGGSVTLRTFNGTRMKLGEETHVTVGIAGYDVKSKARTVECDLSRGQLWACVKPTQGDQSPFEVTCRGTVTTVKGTTLGVDAPGETGPVKVQCLVGSVEAGDGQAGFEIAGGEFGEFLGGELQGEIEGLSDEALGLLTRLRGELSEDSFGQVLRLALNTIEEKTIVSPITAVGSLVRSVGGKSKADSTAIITAHGAMMSLTRALELSTEYPQKVNLETLEGIELDKEGRARILEQFHEGKLLSYKLVGEGYEIVARAKDGEHTFIVARNGKVETVDPSEMESGGKGDTNQ